MKKQPSFSNLTILFFALCTHEQISYGAQKEMTAMRFTRNSNKPQSSTASIPEPSTTEQKKDAAITSASTNLPSIPVSAASSTSTTIPQSVEPGLLGGFLSFFTATTPPQPSNDGKAPSTLSGQLNEQARALFRLRKDQLAERKKLREEQDAMYAKNFNTLSTTATTLNKTPDEFIPRLVTATEKIFLDIRTEEDTAIVAQLEASLLIVNGTRTERGRARAAQRDAGQTKANFRAESPAETVNTFAARITAPKR